MVYVSVTATSSITYWRGSRENPVTNLILDDDISTCLHLTTRDKPLRLLGYLPSNVNKYDVLIHGQGLHCNSTECNIEGLRVRYFEFDDLLLDCRLSYEGPQSLPNTSSCLFTCSHIANGGNSFIVGTAMIQHLSDMQLCAIHVFT